MLPSRRSYRGPLRELMGLVFIAIAASFIWWLLNVAFPEHMKVLIAWVKSLV